MYEITESGGEDELYQLIRVCSRIIHDGGNGKSGQGRILHILDTEGSISQLKLQQMLGVKSGSVSEILTKLEREGLIERKRDEHDRRRVILCMTPKGREHAEEYHAAMRRKDWFAVLDDDERARLKNILQKLLDSWNEPE